MGKNKHNFQKLTPINKANIDIYKDALDYVFNNSDIKNIGISGSYSSGKSSVIETYKTLRPNIKFIHISLAYFQSATKTEEEIIELNENVLEGKILNQLIHQIDPDEIPQTNFKVKRQLSPSKLWLTASLTSMFVVFLLYILNFDNFVEYIENLSPIWIKSFLKVITMPLSTLIAGIGCIVILFFMIFEVIKMQFNKNIFKGISVQGNTIEIFEQSEESYFDKYLNEVLYLFENSGADVIVFEDMDRYNTNQIFQRLREINTLINNRRVNNEGPLRFFYLLRDDIFISKERTKFFDFIMPVVPILDGSNSYDQFIEHFKQGGIFELFDEHFLQGISLYIDDMRILKNIYNEFLIYYKRISTTEQDPNKLLAIIIYKNIFPRDFSDLQLNRGFVYTLFNKKNEFISNEADHINRQIEELYQAIKESESEHLQSNEEVDLIYNPKIQELMGYYYRSEQIQQLEKEREARKENLKNREAERKEVFKSRISELKRSLAALTNKKLCEIINKRNSEDIFRVTFTNEVDVVFDFNGIKNSDYFALIKYLIRKGFIDETYPDYMTYFYENSLSRVDKIFLRSVTDEQAKEYTYKINNPEMVISRLHINDFNNEEVLNFDLVYYLLGNQIDVNKDKLIRVLEQLQDDKNYKFISSYLDIGKHISSFISNLNSIWPTIFDSIVSESSLEYEQKKLYVLESVYYTPNNVIEEMNSEDSLSEFISQSKDFLNIKNPNISRLIEAFNLLNIKFINIDYEVSEKELFNAVYTNNFYEINFEMICLILQNIYQYRENHKLKHKNYTLLLTRPNEPIIAYIKTNINNYIRMILKNCDNCISDSEETIKVVLNDKELELTLKNEYIELLHTSITSLKDIEDISLWAKLIESNVVKYSERNVLEYFFRCDNQFDNLLTEFINNNGSSFDFNYEDINDVFEEGAGARFFLSVVESKELGITPYASILNSLNRVFSSFDIDGISDDKVDILIEQGRITMKAEVLIFMREQYPHKVILFIKQNIKKYSEEVISHENFDFDEMMEIFIEDVADQYKIDILQYTKLPVSILETNYSDELKTYILQHNIDMADIPQILKDYSALGKGVRSAAENIVIKHLDYIIDNKYFVPFKLCKEIFSKPDMVHEDKVRLFTLVLDGLEVSECKECLTLLGLKEYLSVFDGKRPTVPVTDTNKAILEIFLRKYWIAGFDIDKKDSNLYRISSRRIFKKQTLSNELL
ncbi:hypothetical protein NE686_14975 [Tissierella carlieri]|uniref:YobI-like P-loop NTPase domain-containing protein n=1 Tax=Tissierella carlieri TaxID=689904 RepID=A0ABT1SD65_9FIRM|nr:hypothetical protein [Tissierella carlieri]MCQ4924403.1 hypothetical protein [Tissierella carlieri]